MDRVQDRKRTGRLMREAIRDLALDLGDIAVLTEAASGPFAATSLTAALAGSPRVVAVTRDSLFGCADEVRSYVEEWARELGVADQIVVTPERPYRFADGCHLVTNLGFVRPIDSALIERLPADAAVSLMFEPWEFRSEDLDLAACRARGIPVLGTNEAHPRLAVFPYVGMVVLKLMFEAGLEVLRSRVVVIGSRRFGDEAARALVAAGAQVTRLDPVTELPPAPERWRAAFADADAVVLAEFQTHADLLGGKSGVPLDWITEAGAPLIHVCGQMDFDQTESRGLRKLPPPRTRPGFMAASSAYVGPRPVVDLHAGGLKVGELLVRGMRRFGRDAEAEAHALASGIALAFPSAEASDVQAPRR